MMLEHRLFRAPDREALAELGLALDLRSVFAYRNGEAPRHEIVRDHPAAIERNPADADEAIGHADAYARDVAQAAVGRYHDVEAAPRERRRERGGVVWIGVGVLDG